MVSDCFGTVWDGPGFLVAVPKGLHKGGAIQRHGSVRSSAQSSPSRRFLLFQATKRAWLAWAHLGYSEEKPMVFRGFPVLLFNSVRGNSTYDSRGPFFAMEAAIRSTMTRAGEQDDSGKAAWTQNFTPYQLGMQTLTSLVSPLELELRKLQPIIRTSYYRCAFQPLIWSYVAHLSLPNQFPARAFVYHCLRTSGTRSISSRSFNHRQTIRLDAVLPYILPFKSVSHMYIMYPQFLHAGQHSYCQKLSSDKKF